MLIIFIDIIILDYLSNFLLCLDTEYTGTEHYREDSNLCFQGKQNFQKKFKLNFYFK